MKLSRLFSVRRMTRTITHLTNKTNLCHSLSFVVFLSAFAGILFSSALAAAEDLAAPRDYKDKVSYSIGIRMGKSLKEIPFTLNSEYVTRAIKDLLSGAKPLMTEREIEETLTAFQKEMLMQLEAQSKVLGEKNKKEGETFLAQNKRKEGVVVLPSGLQYKVLKPGTGKNPKDSDTVTAHYLGVFVDGTEFDSSYRRGQPTTFPVKGVIRGWTEALQLMQEGAKWQLFIPSNLAYGEQGRPPQIGPNTILIFEVELISIQEKK